MSWYFKQIINKQQIYNLILDNRIKMEHILYLQK